MHTNTRPTMPAAGDVDAALEIAASFLEARRLKHGAARMDATDDAAAAAAAAAADTGGKTFTQADVDRIVGEAKTKAVSRFADYDALKAAAEGSKTLEQRVADLDRELASERVGRIRTQVAAAHGIADLEDVLHGTTKEELETAAKRIADRVKATGEQPPKGKTRTRTVTETSDASRQGLSAKERAAEALRSLGGRPATD